jgi:hypothetical protein
LPQINAIAADYADRGVVVLGVNYKESHAIVQAKQDQYPEILMLEDPKGDAYALYRWNGYIPLNYVLDHDIRQTVDYRMEGYSDTTIRARIEALLAAVSVNLAPDAESFHPGGPLGFDLVFHNWGDRTESVAWDLTALLPGGDTLPVEAALLDLAPGESLTLRRDLQVPGMAPLDLYKMRCRVGQQPSDLWNMDYFDFELLP